jgi:hypothetical protein
MVIRVREGEHFPDWESGFAWISLLGGIPPMFLEVCASGLECEGCECGENKCGEVVEIAGDARRGCSKWRAYFIREYSVKIT